MRPFTVAALLLALLAGPSAALTNPFSNLFNKVVTTPHDQVALPGVPTTVEAKFERDLGLGYANPDLTGKEVEFFYGGASIGKATTNGDGVARRAWTTPAGVTGVLRIQYKMTSSSYRNSAGSLRVFVSAPRPTFVFDIDLTLSDLPEWQVPISGQDAPAFPYAPEFVNHVSGAGFGVIYMTARDDALDVRTRAFLRNQGFPDGAIFYNDLGLRTAEERAMLSSSNHGKYKTRKLRELYAAGIPIVAGVGNTPTDAEAYRAVGMESYILNPSDPIPAGSVIFNNYRQLDAMLMTAAKRADFQRQATAGQQTLTFWQHDLGANELSILVDGVKLSPVVVAGSPGWVRAKFFRLAKRGSKLTFQGEGPANDFAYAGNVDIVDGAGAKVHDGPNSWALLQTAKGQSSTVTVGP